MYSPKKSKLGCLSQCICAKAQVITEVLACSEDQFNKTQFC